MKEEKPNRGEELGKALRAKGLALAIPMTLLTFPIAGALAGKFLADYFEKRWILPLLLILSLVLALRETIVILKRLNAQQDRK